MLIVVKTDNFERKYMEKFRSFSAQFGEIISYERDRGGRDIGIHLTHKFKSGKERLSTAICWFQMKGIMASTMSSSDYEMKKEIPISLKVNHLRFWYLQPVPTYLAIYIECVDHFLILNVKDYVTRSWGRKILTLDQITATVRVSKESLLDEQAFRLILSKCDLEEYQKALGVESHEVHFCVRDYNLIWHLGTAEEREVEHRIVFWDWQSKTRAQFYIQERAVGSDENWITLREHWQYMMEISDLQNAYPYLEYSADEDRECALSWEYEDQEYGPVNITLPNGDVIIGEDAAGEYFLYEMRVKLNEIGGQAFVWVKHLKKLGFVELNTEMKEVISIAPWHGRDV